MITPLWTAEAIRFGHDAESGADIEQLTSEPVTSNNIYCEQRYASADGARIAIARKPFGQPTEIWVCDLRSLKVCKAVVGNPLGANSPRNAIYYTAAHGDKICLMCLDLTELTSREMFRFYDNEPPSYGAVSSDERWFITGPVPVKDNIFSLRRVDLASGKANTLCEIEDMFNPHIQFEPVQGRLSVVQINRGGQWNPVAGVQVLTGPLGATLSLVNVESGEVSPLPVGRPHTPSITGHECWAGKSGKLLFTAGHFKVSSSSYVTLKDASESGGEGPTIYSVTPGEKTARIIAQGLMFNHVAASDDGRFFIADDHTIGRVYIGNIATGKYLPLCETHTRQGKPQYSHAHAYMTPDNRHVIFNSIVTGTAQVYAACIPDGFLDKVMKQ